MDEIRASQIADELIGREIAGWKICGLVGHGKSAVVLRGEKDGQSAAIKVFDRELVEKYGKETQLRRVERELSLKGHGHANLVEILDGGECANTGYLFVVMEFVDSPNLADVVKVVPREMIWPVIEQLAEAAKFLEEREIAHRDIKPSNIVISSDFRSPVLLDLGVILPFGDGDLTDDESRPFIGTLRYSPPEFLIREEDGSREGWRAVSIYQIGGVLHDLVMRQQLFSEYGHPYARLVKAVESEDPQISAPDVDPELVLLARNCLVKQPDVRLKLVSWDSFKHRADSTSPNAARVRVRARRLRMEVADVGGVVSQDEQRRAKARAVHDVMESVEQLVRLQCAGNPDFPPIDVRKHQINDDTWVVVAFFSRSAAHEMQSSLCICINVRFLSPTARIVEVEAAACLAASRVDKNELDGVTFVPIYAGVFDRDHVSKRVEELMYVGLDEAQQSDLGKEADREWMVLTNLDSGGADE